MCRKDGELWTQFGLQVGLLSKCSEGLTWFDLEMQKSLANAVPQSLYLGSCNRIACLCHIPGVPLGTTHQWLARPGTTVAPVTYSCNRKISFSSKLISRSNPQPTQMSDLLFEEEAISYRLHSWAWRPPHAAASDPVEPEACVFVM